MSSERRDINKVLLGVHVSKKYEDSQRDMDHSGRYNLKYHLTRIVMMTVLAFPRYVILLLSLP